jgi:DNA-binding NarL/FixJ family response regulator
MDKKPNIIIVDDPSIFREGLETIYQKMVAAGAKVLILKSGGINVLENAIKVVMKGKCYFPRNLPEEFQKVLT